ncbi:MAG: SGNH/GDSL hydrolase family protein [Caldilineaceae bacterium]
MQLKANTILLFQGDSITDANRSRENTTANSPSALGSGYVNLIAAKLLRSQPADGLQILNRGISGNRVVDLYGRWKVDGLNLQPDLISILIGVNDTWHGFMYDNGVEVERFATLYRMLLHWTKQQLPNVQLVLCEPFVLPCGVVTEAWMSEMSERQSVVRELANDFQAIFVPFQSAFNTAMQDAPAAYWAQDGVHPTPAGHQLMAESWLQSVVNQ